MVLVLGRGAFCPKDCRQAEGLLQLHPGDGGGYCRLVTITTDDIVKTNEFRSGAGAHWPFLSDPRRIVQKDLDIAGRPTVEELRQDHRAVSKKCRPDWDITRPELKAQWKNGHKELFYPYGRSYVETLSNDT